MAPPSSLSAWDLLQAEKESSLPPRLLDGDFAAATTTDGEDYEWLRLHPGQIYELAGPAGVGKTQMALHLCLRLSAGALLTNNGAAAGESEDGVVVKHQNSVLPRAAYVSLGGKGKLSKVVQRLSDMANGDMNLLKGVVTRSVANEDDWTDDVLNKELPDLLQKANGHVRVVVVDALADLFRACEDHSDRNNNQSNSNNKNQSSIFSDRASQLCEIAQRLKRLADKYHTTILVLNQVTGNDDRPALGLAWSHCCNASFGTLQQDLVAPPQVQQHGGQENQPANQGYETSECSTSLKTVPRRRTLMLRKSPRYPGGSDSTRVNFWIDKNGVHPAV